jgi:hypothetical protein
VLLLSAMDRYHIVSQFKQRERVVIIDLAGTYYLSPLLQFSEAKDLHIQQAELATMASPYGNRCPLTAAIAAFGKARRRIVAPRSWCGYWARS